MSLPHYKPIQLTSSLTVPRPPSDFSEKLLACYGAGTGWSRSSQEWEVFSGAASVIVSLESSSRHCKTPGKRRGATLKVRVRARHAWLDGDASTSHPVSGALTEALPAGWTDADCAAKVGSLLAGERVRGAISTAVTAWRLASAYRAVRDKHPAVWTAWLAVAKPAAIKWMGEEHAWEAGYVLSYLNGVEEREALLSWLGVFQGFLWTQGMELPSPPMTFEEVAAALAPFAQAVAQVAAHQLAMQERARLVSAQESEPDPFATDKDAIAAAKVTLPKPVSAEDLVTPETWDDVAPGDPPVWAIRSRVHADSDDWRFWRGPGEGTTREPRLTHAYGRARAEQIIREYGHGGSGLYEVVEHPLFATYETRAAWLAKLGIADVATVAPATLVAQAAQDSDDPFAV